MTRTFRLALPIALLTTIGCSTAPAPLGHEAQALQDSSGNDDHDPQPSAQTPPGAVGLAVEVDGGNGIPLTLRTGQSYWLNQIDVRASLDTTVDEGVNGLIASGDFPSASWAGNTLIESEFEALPNADGTWTKRAFYRNAIWMEAPSWFWLTQLDANGRELGSPVVVFAGDDYLRLPFDDFWVRRMRAIQWTNNCASPSDCSTANSFQEEALIELRNALGPERSLFKLDARTTALKLAWSFKPSGWIIPVTQTATPPFDYGFSIDLVPLTPPRHDGTYAPGSTITFQVTLKDGSGHRLHPPGSLPKYLDVIYGIDNSGIQYYRGFFDPTITYYRRKHRERQLLAELLGPAQDIQPIRSLVQVATVLGPNDTDPIANIATDGVYGELRAFPTGNALFGGAFDPLHTAWFNPVPDSWDFHLPADAPSGTYYATIKGRRTFMGEDIPFTRTVNIQVGTPKVTTPVATTGNCQSCHTGNSSLSVILHANANTATCHACHAPLAFEYEGPIYVRAHFIHSRSHRFDKPLTDCSTCHLTQASIERVSKSACLSCHTSYPADHVQKYGPVTNMFIGNTPDDSFQQCTSSCHRNHPDSRL